MRFSKIEFNWIDFFIEKQQQQLVYALSYTYLFCGTPFTSIILFPWTKQFLCIIYIWKKKTKKSISIFLFSQNTIITAMRTSKPQQTGVQSTAKPHKWTYASAFLYSLTLITTIGKCVFIFFFFLFQRFLFIYSSNDGMSLL